jgi:hypothetical protein
MCVFGCVQNEFTRSFAADYELWAAQEQLREERAAAYWMDW